jgi:apolipoprotein N-acyltransferase
MERFKEWIKDKHIIHLVVGTIFSAFSIGRFNIIISIYIWPFCFLNYLHKNEKKIVPLLIVSLCLLFTNIIRWIGYSLNSFGEDIIFGVYYTIINIIPFIIDNIFYNKISKLKSIFVFPLSVAICEFLFGFFYIANFNIYAYAHRENTQYLQIISLFGTYFLSFIIALFASILDYSLAIINIEKKISKFILAYTIIILIIYFFGFIRLLIPLEKGTYNIACSTGVSQYIYDNGDDPVLPIDNYTNYINDKLFMANYSKSQIMIFAEEAFALINETNREEMINKTKELAKEYNIFIVLPLDVEIKENKNRNEAVLISNKGEILYEYQKQNLIPLVEEDYYEDMGKPKVIDTDLGKLTIAICYDINFPYYINSLSRKHFDILLIPSWDWEGIAEFHSNNAKYRAIEGGFNLIKNTVNGITISIDAKGRVLSYHIGRDYGDYFLTSTVNKKGIKTLYSYIGFLFNFLYIIVLCCILIPSSIFKKYCCSNKRRANSYGMQKLNELNIDNEDD